MQGRRVGQKQARRGRRLGAVRHGGPAARIPAARNRSPGLRAMERTRDVLSPSVSRSRPMPRSQTLMTPSCPRETRALPPPRTARLRTASAWPRSVARSWRLGEAAVRTRARLSDRHVPHRNPAFAAREQRLAVRRERQASDPLARCRVGQGECRGKAAQGHVPERNGRVAVG